MPKKAAKPKARKKAPAKSRAASKTKPKAAQPQSVFALSRIVPVPVSQDRWLRLLVASCTVLFASVFVLGLAINIKSLDHTRRPISETVFHDSRSAQQLDRVSKEVSALTAAQSQSENKVADAAALNRELITIQADIQAGERKLAAGRTAELHKQVQALALQLKRSNPGSAAAASAVTSLNVPILVYHYTPGNFDALLDDLEHKGYHTITLDQLAAALDHTGSLPDKPVVITFDDGFKNQLAAFDALKKHHMVATYYIISGSERSLWCIGANRRYNDPLQPPSGCGDDYMDWGDIEMLDRSGVITIGAHTVDHENLPALPIEAQRWQILANKQGLEKRLGHAVKHFAYPYGSFDGNTIALVSEAGFATAVSTAPGTDQSADNLYGLYRVRDISTLP